MEQNIQLQNIRHLLVSNEDVLHLVLKRAKNLLMGLGLTEVKKEIKKKDLRYSLYHTVVNHLLWVGNRAMASNYTAQLQELEMIVDLMSQNDGYFLIGIADVFPINVKSILHGCLYNADRLLLVLSRWAQSLHYVIPGMPISFYIDKTLSSAINSKVLTEIILDKLFSEEWTPIQNEMLPEVRENILRPMDLITSTDVMRLHDTPDRHNKDCIVKKFPMKPFKFNEIKTKEKKLCPYTSKPNIFNEKGKMWIQQVGIVEAAHKLPPNWKELVLDSFTHYQEIVRKSWAKWVFLEFYKHQKIDSKLKEEYWGKVLGYRYTVANAVTTPSK